MLITWWLLYLKADNGFLATDHLYRLQRILNGKKNGAYELERIQGVSETVNLFVHFNLLSSHKFNECAGDTFARCSRQMEIF